ncbi:MAG: type II toxin-antitoxin system mRNA interferase toxin, RelE/StbE family [Syntrophus sp. (in: bacteria)]|nr:type II toxin-antitoxin system mRNA interferase toxin, RelE/StbE family [Syntrophus sp. (in: bacteria)]
MPYTIEIVPRAEKEYLKLPNDVRGQIRKKILSLEENPKPFGSKKLRETDYYRVRAGDYRVIYIVDDNKKRVLILSLAHRKEVYR